MRFLYSDNGNVLEYGVPTARPFPFTKLCIFFMDDVQLFNVHTCTHAAAMFIFVSRIIVMPCHVMHCSAVCSVFKDHLGVS